MTNENQTSGEEKLSNEDILAMLKTKAENMGVAYGPRIGIDALREKINKALSDDPVEDADEGEDEAEAKAEKAAQNSETRKLTKIEREAQMRHDIQSNAMRLVRLRISNLNPAKKEVPGEIFTVANRFIGNVKKYIPYGEATDSGYHVPHVIYEQMKERKYLSVKTKTVNGQIEVMTRWVPEFALEILDPLTPVELKKLAVQQAVAAGNSGDDEE